MRNPRRLQTRMALLAALAAFGVAAAGTAGPGGLAADGAAQPLPAFGGTYGTVSASAAMDPGGFTRSLGFGALTLDARTGTFSLSAAEKEMRLAESCRPEHGPCGRSFHRTTHRSTTIVSGTYALAGPGRIAFTTARSAAGPGETVEGFANPSGSVIVIPFARPNGLNLVVAVRPGSDVSTDALAGTYNVVMRAAEFPKPSVSRDGAWTSYASEIQSGTVTFSGTAFAADARGSRMREEVACSALGSGCSLSAALESSPTGGALSTGQFAVSTSGLAILKDDSRDLLLHGLVSPDGGLLVALEDASARGRQGMHVMTRRGAGLSSASLRGVFNTFALEDFFDSDARIRAALVAGQITFDGSGGWGFLGSDSSVKRVECQGAEPCPWVALSSQTFVGATAGGTYTTGPNGELTMTGTAADGTPRLFLGSVAADGSLIVLRRTLDSDASSCVFDCAALQSVRSLIIGLRGE